MFSQPLAAAFAALVAFVPAPAICASPTVDPFLAAARMAQRPMLDSTYAAPGEQGVVLTGAYAPINQGMAMGHGVPMTPGVEGYCPPPEMMGGGDPWGYGVPGGGWGWTALPDGLIYRSYQAGPRESRLGLHTMQNSYAGQKSEVTWDATLGGRKGLIRYGNHDAVNPIGWQLDIEGATIVRLNLDEARDVDSSDFRFGVPLTYTAGDGVSYKFGYYHLSSHLGDELIARTGVNSRVNYVRDAIIAGVSYQMAPSLRVYGETAFAFFTAGGAEPWEFQFGAEWSRPGPTGFAGTPFLATNAHLREEVNFGGDWTLQTGWLWRGETGSTMRLGLHYMNGKSTQYQFFNRNEEQLGFGIWCDF